MKKIVLIASLFVAFSVSAQQGKNNQGGFRQEQQQYKHQNKFAGIKLSKAQEKKIYALDQQKLSSNQYDARVKKILTKSQYSKYLQNTHGKQGYGQQNHNQPQRR